MGRSTDINARFFLVGCPRSGTTLLQSILGSHPQVASFPESWCFPSTVGYFPQRLFGTPVRYFKEALGRRLRELRAALGIADANARRDLQTFLEGLQREDLLDLFPRRGRALGAQMLACIRILDRLAQDEGKPYWVEKTPMHLGYLDFVVKSRA